MKSLLLLSALLLATALFAQPPGTLDPSFANKGILIDPSVKNFIGETVRVNKDGRILIASAGPYKGLPYTFKIDARLPDGSPDLSFGEEGSAYVIFPGKPDPSTYSAGISALALLPDGRILAAGGLQEVGNPGDIAFARFLPNGTLDSSFGTNGTATTSFGYFYEGISSIALLPNGRIAAAGNTSRKINGGGFGDYVYQFATFRFLPDGKKDPGFGNGGVVVSNDGIASSVVVQEDGKIVAAGVYSGNINIGGDVRIERFNTDGSYDKSFGVNGIVDAKINGASVNFINDISLQPDGKLVAAGVTNDASGNYKFTTLRYNTDGSLDKSFAGSGFITNTFSQYSEGIKVMIAGEKKDKIVVAGSASPDGIGYDFAVVSYNMDGSLDQDFGNKGIQMTDPGGTDAVTSADLQPDGKIVLLGYAESLETFDSYRALTRYYGYPQRVPLAIRIRRWLHNHGISWKGLPAEDKIAYYAVEQSPNGTSGFTQVAKVSGVANLKDYSLTNSRLLQGSNYYRIKAVSTDGVIRYSEVASAGNTANTASIFPNPAKSYVTVQGLAANETANISITDGSGTVLQRGVSTGSAQYRSALGSNMQPGTYYLNITTGSKTEVLKFVKE